MEIKRVMIYDILSKSRDIKPQVTDVSPPVLVNGPQWPIPAV